MARSNEGTKRLSGRAKDIVAGMVGRLAAKTAGAHSTTSFIRNAAIGDMYEIEAAKLALKRARSPRVKEIAQRMIDDHTTNIHQLQSALRMNETRGEASAPTNVDARRRKMLDNLRATADADFDEAYLEQQVLAHKETVDLMTGYRDRGANPQMRSLAAGAAPVVQRHLQHMEALRGELAG